MKAFAVEHPLHKPGMDYFHYCFFHGREAREWPHWRAGIPFFGDKEKRPLRLLHNARRIPDVFSPKSSLVVSARVRDALGELPFVEYRPVTFPRLIECDPPTLGDRSYEDNPAYRKATASEEWERDAGETLFEHFPEASAQQRESVGSYYEIVVPRLTEAAAEFPESKPIQVPRPYNIGNGNELRLCPALLKKYPVVWWSQVVFAEWAFRRIEPFLDRAYAEVVEFEVVAG
jgi:hypothetical protein